MTLLVDLFFPSAIATSLAPRRSRYPRLALMGRQGLPARAMAVTLVESTNAKLRFFRVPELMSVSLGLGFLALAMRFL